MCPNAAELVQTRKALRCFHPDQYGEVKICCNVSPNPTVASSTTQNSVNFRPPLTVRPAPQNPQNVRPPATPAPQNPSHFAPPATPPQQYRPTVRPPVAPAIPQNPQTANRFKNSTATAILNCEKYAEYRYAQKWVDPSLPGEVGYWHGVPDCVIVETLISGGAAAESREYPHMALIGYGNDFKDVQWACGGSLISERFILSAAHCGRQSAQGVPRWALLGDLNLTSTDDKAKPQIYRIVKVYDHPNYKAPSYYNDISLFELNTTVAMSPFVRPACLHTSTASQVNSKASITGWGAVGHGYRHSDHLLKATIEVMDDERCRESYNTKSDVRLSQGYDANSMMCAGDYAGVNDTCSGDSGGPMQALIGKMFCMWDVIGVTSFGKICGNSDEPEPGVYTKVAYYLDWIQSIVWP
ncbi:serine protease persephone-like isoform X2 [Planococcus citri]